MTLSFSFNLPTDIPWKKICTTNDMMDRVVCDVELPPKWQSSIAMFKYVPADEYQLYPDYKITYLKATVTVTGYQPLDDEIQGEIDWNGVDITTLDGLTELLNSYYPCNGAILQIVVGPKGANPTIPFDQYPFFFDFEPKKRELYEMATDTKEKQSRSVETLNITKGAGSVQSTEVMDVDMGGSWNAGVQGGAGGASGGISGGSSTQGQWGTKSMDTQQNQVDRSQEAGTEKRETLSHTTQLSQLYHLLDTYHLGTNRAVFFMQPRPHVVEEPSGFVRGPRKLEGVQEFFMIVAQPKTQEEFCVSARLDTGHLIETDVLDYERKTDVTNLVSVVAPIPTKNDQPDGTAKRRACFLGQCWDVIYKCFKTRRVADEVYSAPEGFVIEGYTDLVSETSNGSTSVTIAQGNRNLTIHVEAQGRCCFEDSGFCLDCPDEIEKTGGYARRQVQVNLVSEEPSEKVGTQQSLLVTTRGLCCCPQTDLRNPDVRVTGVYPVPEYLGGGFLNTTRLLAAQRVMASGMLMTASTATTAAVSGQTTTQSGGLTQCECRKTTATSSLPVAPLTMQMDPMSQNERRLSLRQANGVNDFIRQSMVRSFRDPRMGSEPKRFIETDLFANQLESFIRRSRAGRQKLRRAAKDVAPEKVIAAVAKQLNTKPEAVTAMDVLFLRNHEYKRAAAMEAAEVSRVKLQLLGVPLKKKS
jgi:hypothetical protein